MAWTGDITLDRTDEILAALGDLGPLVTASAARIEAAAKMAAPVDTGALRASIRAETVGPAEATVSVGMEYGAHVEFGTSQASAQPFFVPAVEQERPRLIEAIKRVLERAAG